MGEVARFTPPFTRALAAACAALLVLTSAWVTTAPARAADWRPVEPAELAQVATLEPSSRDADGIPLDATFTLTSLTSTPAAELAAGLSVEPSIELETLADTASAADPSTVTLSPTEALTPGRHYRFELRRADGSLAGSWAYRTQSPLQIIGTLPGDRDDWTRPNTGIEITFDHSGLIEPGRHFSIQPPVKGRFEVRGNILSFIPARPLATSTVYTVTLEPGIQVQGSEARLEEAFSFSFQTRAGKEEERVPVRFVTEVVESGPDQRPSMEVWLRRRGKEDVDVVVHRFRTLDQVVDAMRSIQNGSDWGTAPRLALPTDGLRRMGTVTGSLRRADPHDGSLQALTLPDPLPNGWYVLTIEDPTADQQAILQVSDLAAYAHVSQTDSLFWVNSLAGDGPVAEAEVSIVGGASLGSTDEDGLLVIDTPATLTSSDPVPLLSVRTDDAAVLLPFAIGQRWTSPNIERGSGTPGLSDRFWTYLNLDRYAYRATDAVNIWGLARSRDDGSVPDEVELRLVSEDDQTWDATAVRPALATAIAKPSPTGVFSASLRYEDLPLGYYVVEALVDGEPFGQGWLEVASIIKPAYRLAVDTPRRAFMDGDAIDVEVEATFFDGTVVPAAPLTVTSRGSRRAPTTDATGTARMSLPARHPGGRERQIAIQSIRARPATSEEGEIVAGTNVAVVASSLYLDAAAMLRGGHLRLDGSVHHLDLDLLHHQMADESPSEESFWSVGSRLDPRGRPAEGTRVTARVTELVPVRKKTGTVYDFIAKAVIPTYEWDSKERPAGVFELSADADGAYSLEVEGKPRSDFFVDLSATDARGRTARQRIWAERYYRYEPGARPYLAFTGDLDLDDGWPTLGVGDDVTVELRQGPGRQPSGGPDRYLFLIQHRGLRGHVVQPTPVLDLTFREEYIPSVTLGAVRFTGDAYVAVPDELHIPFDAEERALGLEIAPARERYAPGDRVELSLRTTDHAGQPVPASVVLHAIDEKLYAMGLVGDTDPLRDIYTGVGSGLVRTYASHQRPGATPQRGGKGDTGGGGSPRSDFRDVLLFRQVETDADGRATISFGTSDDLTSWRITAAGVSAAIDVGAATSLVSVGLPFFVDVISADDYLAADEAHILVRAFGSAVDADVPVTFSVSAPSLGLDEDGILGTAFRPIDVDLPPLTEGLHEVTVSAEAVVDGVSYSDAVVRPVRVRPSRLVQRRTEHVPLVAGVPVPGGDSLTSVLISDEGRGRFYPELVELAWSDGPRADQALAASQARALLDRWFRAAESQLPAPSFDATQFQRADGSIALLPFGGRDEALSFLVALAAPDAVDGPLLARWFRELQHADRTTTERALRAAAARAALGDDVLDDLTSIAAEAPLSAPDSLVYAIGLAAAGDRDAALAIERELLAEHGQQLGEWVRLRLPAADRAADGSAAEAEARDTALLSILAAELGDDATALAADAYVRENPTDETIVSLQHIAVIDRLIERSPAEPASFSLELDGERQVVELEPGSAHHLTLSAFGRAAIELEPGQGSLGVSSTWAEPIDPSAAGQTPAISVRRTVRPQGPIAANGMAEVTLDVRLGESAVPGCYLVTDMAPSGLAPVRRTAGWPRRRDRGGDGERVIGPISIQGQRVDFCISAGSKRPVHTLRYLGRVVTPGAYAWEPALVQSTAVAGVWRLGEAGVLELGGVAGGGPLGGAVSADDADASSTGRAPSTRREHEAALMSRLAPIECQRWREDDQPFDFGAVAAVQCDRPDFGISQLALFTFTDVDRLREFWTWRIDQVDLGAGSRETACADGRAGLVTFDGGEAACYVSGAGSGVAKIRWIDERSRTYGVLDAIDSDIAALFAWWGADRS